MGRSPNFFILGAPKCGTSTMAWWLSQHPQVFMSKQKEPHFFNTDTRRIITRRDKYFELFADAPQSALAIGEASTRYLRSADAVPNILVEIDNPRFVVCLRNPVDMAVSLHNQKIMDGIETIKDFEEAWDAQGRRRKGVDVPKEAESDPSLLFYYDYCLLGEQVASLLDLVHSNHVQFVFLDDLSKNANAVYRQVQNFLGLEIVSLADGHSKNIGRGVRSTALRRIERRVYRFLDRTGMPKRPFRAISQALNRKKSVPEVSLRLRRQLWSDFEKDVMLLSNLLGRDLQHWRVE